MILKMRMTPYKVGRHQEQVMLSFKRIDDEGDFYPSAMVHIDTFDCCDHNGSIIMEKLRSGDTVDTTIVIEDDDPPDEEL